MLKIAVIGSEFFGKFVQDIVRKNIFPHIQLEYINDITFIDYPAMVKATLQVLERENCQALVLGPYDYSVIAPHTNLPCYVLHPGSFREFLLLYPQIRGCKNPAVICPTTDILDLSVVLKSALELKYHIYYYEDLRKIEYTSGRRETKRASGGHWIEHYIQYGKAFRIERILLLQPKERRRRNSKCGADHSKPGSGKPIYQGNQYHLENATCGVIYLMRDALTLNYVNRTALEMLQYNARGFFSAANPRHVSPACIGSAAGQQSTKKLRYSSLCAVLK